MSGSCQHTTWDHVNGHRRCTNAASYVSTVSQDVYCQAHYSIGLDVPIQAEMFPEVETAIAGQVSLW